MKTLTIVPVLNVDDLEQGVQYVVEDNERFRNGVANGLFRLVDDAVDTPAPADEASVAAEAESSSATVSL